MVFKIILSNIENKYLYFQILKSNLNIRLYSKNNINIGMKKNQNETVINNWGYFSTAGNIIILKIVKDIIK